MDNKTIIVVDDSKTILLKVSLMLKKHGFNPITTSECLDVVEMIKQSKPALVVLDVEMPGMSGYQLCEIIKEDSAVENVPIVFFTTRDEYMDRLKGFAMGAQGYLTKDTEEEFFISTVKQLIEENPVTY